MGSGAAAPAGLGQVHVCTVMRRSIEIDAHGGRVEVAFDRGEIHADAGLAPVCARSSTSSRVARPERCSPSARTAFASRGCG